MTSNLQVSAAYLSESERDNEIRQQLGEFMRPELVNRINEIIQFKSLSRLHFQRMLARELKILNQRLVEREIRLEFSSRLETYLIQNAELSGFGGRELGRSMQRLVVDALAEKLLSNQDEFKGLWVLDWDNESGLLWTRDHRQDRYLPAVR